MKLGVTLMCAAAALAVTPALAQAPAVGSAEHAREILKRSVAFRTVEGQGQMPAYAAYLAGELKKGGFQDSEIEITPMGETATLVVRYPGTSPDRKPIVLLGHMDVVEAKASDWERDPFTPVEENGYVFGRGAEDNKYDVSVMVATLAKLRASGFRPGRDIYLALSGDEETQMLTTRALAERFKGAEMALNGDGGGGYLGEDGKPMMYALQAAEKTYTDYQIVFTNPGGHSSGPRKDNAIYRLADALRKVAAYKFAPQANELTRASLKAASVQVGGEVGAAMARFAANPADVAAAERISEEPDYIGQVRTTCVATMAEAGHAPNALPQRAAATVNCRIFPGVSPAEVKATLAEVIDDDTATINILGDPAYSDASPLRPDVMAAITKAVQARYPGLPIVPAMSAGATDSLHFRAKGVPSYGVGSLFQKSSDSFAHGLNERVPVGGLEAAIEQWRSLLTDLGK